jgi:hypothetical protein
MKSHTVTSYFSKRMAIPMAFMCIYSTVTCDLHDFTVTSNVKPRSLLEREIDVKAFYPAPKGKVGQNYPPLMNDQGLKVSMSA